MNTFGRYFRVTTFGEAAGPALGVLLDGVPPGMDLDLEDIQYQVERCMGRAGEEPGKGVGLEEDRISAWSGLVDGLTSGAPLCLLISNPGEVPDLDEALAGVFRPGHADYTLEKKFGIRDHRGGGWLTFRENLPRVVAGAVARQVLAQEGITVLGHTQELGGARALSYEPVEIARNPLCCADPDQVEAMAEAIHIAFQAGDTLGGLVEVRCSGVPVGLGDPVFGKLDARLAGGLMGIDGARAVGIGAGFKLARMRGSEANDPIGPEGFESNHAGGILGGISNGEEVVARVGFSPAPNTKLPQSTVDSQGNPTVIAPAEGYVPCLVPRLVPVAEAMVAMVLADALLSQRMICPAGVKGSD